MRPAGGRREDETLNGSWREAGDELGVIGTLSDDGDVALEVQGPGEGVSGSLTGTLTMSSQGLALRGVLTTTGAPPRDVALAEEWVTLDPGAALVPRTWIDEDAERGWSIQAEIPTAVAARGAGLGPGHLAFNAAVDSMIQADLAPFRQMAIEHEPPPDLDVGSFYESVYSVTLAQDGLVSLAFDVTTYMGGAALDTLSAFAIPILMRDLGEYGEAEWIEDGAGPEAENYARWTLTTDGLRFVFDPYQVAPYAAGPQVVVVPWSAIEPHLDPAGPVAKIDR